MGIIIYMGIIYIHTHTHMGIYIYIYIYIYIMGITYTHTHTYICKYIFPIYFIKPHRHIEFLFFRFTLSFQKYSF